MRDHKPITLTEFNGLWKCGTEDTTPKDHFTDCNNIQFVNQGFTIRDGVDVYLPYSNIVRIYTFNRNDGEGLLVLDSLGNIYHTTAPNPFQPILSIVGMTDFAFVGIADRAYISPSNGITGLPDEYIYVYDGVGNPARRAGGFPPELTTDVTVGIPKPFTVFNSELDSGTTAITKGVHIFAVFFQAADLSNSKLGPEVFAVLDAPGSKQATLLNVPINRLDLDIVRRGIACTKALSNTFDDTGTWPIDVSSLTFYFVGYIEDATTTSLTGAVRDEDLTVDVSALLSAGTGSTPLPTPITNAFYGYGGDLGGNQDIGFKLIGVVYETASGFLTAPGPEFYAPVVALRNDIYINLLNIPVSNDPNVQFKHLVASKVIENYNGDQSGYTLYFIPGARIANSVTTYRVSFFDADLLDDASHLSDNYSFLDAVVGLGTYHNRLLAWTKSNDTNLVMVSQPGEPEAISQIDGLLLLSRDGNPVTRCQEFRDVLYTFKQTKTIAYNDNGDVPSSWPSVVLDEGLGTALHGIAEVLDSGGVNVDFLIVAGYTGILLFNGSYIKPELSVKIKDLWDSQNKFLFNKIQLINDTIGLQLFIVLTNNNFLIGDYNNGLDPKNIRWSPWSFNFSPSSISLINNDKLIISALKKVIITTNEFDYSGSINAQFGIAATYNRLRLNFNSYLASIDAQFGINADTLSRRINIYNYNGQINVFFDTTSLTSRLNVKSYLGQIDASFVVGSLTSNKSTRISTYVGNIAIQFAVAADTDHSTTRNYLGNI